METKCSYKIGGAGRNVGFKRCDAAVTEDGRCKRHQFEAIAARRAATEAKRIEADKASVRAFYAARGLTAPEL